MSELFETNSCYSKKRYSTEEYAQKLANKRAYERKVKLRVYGCHVCGGYHITSKDKRDELPKLTQGT